MLRILVNVFGLFLFGILGACQYTQPTQTIVETRVTWIDYLGADDIRRNCDAAGGPERYRMVLMADAYGAGVGNQARGLDLIVAANGDGELSVQVDRGLRFSGLVDIFDVGATPVGNAPLRADQVDRIRTALDQSGAFGEPPVGLRLNSRRHFWVVSGCRSGAYFLTAFAFPETGWSQLTFPAELEAVDPLADEIAWPRAPNRQPSPPRCANNRRNEDGPAVCYTVEIGANGLVR